jgi:predicted ATPase
MQICEALEGIPLAIELAAARLRSLTWADLAARLDDQLCLLGRRRGAEADDRHVTLQATLDWSSDLLTDEQRELARRLSVFAGGFRLDAAGAVGGPTDVLDTIDELVAKSLLTFDWRTARYRMLEPIRQYFASHLVTSGEAPAVLDAHASWIIATTNHLGTYLLQDQRARSQRLREEGDNIDAALGHLLETGDIDGALQVVGALGYYWLSNDQARGRRWTHDVLGTSDGAGTVRRARALVSAAILAQEDRDWPRSIEMLRDAIAVLRRAGRPGRLADAIFWLGRALGMRFEVDGDGDLAVEARACFEEALEIQTLTGNVLGVGWCQLWLAQAAYWDDDLDEAEARSLQVLEVASGTHPAGQALRNLAYHESQRGRLDAALAHTAEAAALYRQLDDPWQLAGMLVELSFLQTRAGNFDAAFSALAESAGLATRIARSNRFAIFGAAAVVHLGRGRADLATAALGAYDVFVAARDLQPWAAAEVDAARARLDPVAVAAAAAAVRGTPVDELVDRLILDHAASTNVADDGGTLAIRRVP